MRSRSGFTLIELLVVIAIIAILAVVVVLTLNPAELLRQSRDANRVSDMATLNSAVNLYIADQSGASGFSLGAASTSYLSVPSASSSCNGLGLATSAYAYACSTSLNYRNATGSGWLPVNFQNLSSGSPLSNLPVDPINQTSSNLYYSYETNGSQFVLGTFMESQKYAKQMMTAGGVDPALYEIGSGASILPNASRGLVGYWPLDEGSGAVALDWSGEGNNGTITGATWTSGKTSANALQFYGGTHASSTPSYVTLNTAQALNPSFFTINAWMNITTSTNSYNYIYSNIRDCCEIDNGFSMRVAGQTASIQIGNSGGISTFSGGIVPLNTWAMITGTYDGSVVATYVNGVLVHTASYSGAVGQPATYVNTIGALAYSPGTFSTVGSIDDVRLYNRALSAAEIQEIYNAEQ